MNDTPDGPYISTPEVRFVKLEQLAIQHNRHIVPARADQLQLDLDGDDAVRHFDAFWESMQGLFPAREWCAFPSRSGNTHVIIWLAEEMPIRERIMYQALLGSDPKREAMSLLRVYEGQPHPLVLLLDDDGLEFSRLYIPRGARK